MTRPRGAQSRQIAFNYKRLVTSSDVLRASSLPAGRYYGSGPSGSSDGELPSHRTKLDVSNPALSPARFRSARRACAGDRVLLGIAGGVISARSAAAARLCRWGLRSSAITCPRCPSARAAHFVGLWLRAAPVGAGAVRHGFSVTR